MTKREEILNHILKAHKVAMNAKYLPGDYKELRTELDEAMSKLSLIDELETRLSRAEALLERAKDFVDTCSEALDDEYSAASHNWLKDYKELRKG